GTAIGSAAAPFAGTFKPSQALSAMNGRPSNGTWKLQIADVAAGDTGTLFCFRLTITRANYPAVVVDDVAVSEGAAGTTTVVNVPVTRIGDTSKTGAVNFSTASGTAVSGNDFVAKSGTLTFAGGEVTKSVP